LLRAFATVRERRPNTRLAIFGEGEQEQKLVELSEALGISDHIQFFGYVNNPFRYLARADLFVLSSAWEGFGNVLTEALACRCPIVSTDCPSGPREILQDGEYGIIVPVGDADGMATAIIQSLDTDVMIKKLRERAQDFSVETIVDEYEAVLTSNSKTRVQ
jgi:glycosyltransferase involved in cell wall biosynthesis